MQQGISVFFPLIIGEIGHSITVLDFTHHEDSDPTCLIWWSFGWDIWGKRQWVPFERQTSLQVYTDSSEMKPWGQPSISQSSIHQIQRSIYIMGMGSSVQGLFY